MIYHLWKAPNQLYSICIIFKHIFMTATSSPNEEQVKKQGAKITPAPKSLKGILGQKKEE